MWAPCEKVPLPTCSWKEIWVTKNVSLREAFHYVQFQIASTKSHYIAANGSIFDFVYLCVCVCVRTPQRLTFMETKKYLKMTMSKISNQSMFHPLSVGYMLDHVGLSQCTLNSGRPSSVRIALPIWRMNHPKLRITPFLISMVTTSVALLNRIMTQSLTLAPGKTGSLTPYSICVCAMSVSCL